MDGRRWFVCAHEIALRLINGIKAMVRDLLRHYRAQAMEKGLQEAQWVRSAFAVLNLSMQANAPVDRKVALGARRDARCQ
jgi:hypothetical protein